MARRALGAGKRKCVSGIYGEWGGPPDIVLVNVGPERHGVVVSWDFMGQGYASSKVALLAPLGTTLSEVWHIQDEQDDAGAYDPADKMGQHVLYRSSAAFKFCSCDEDSEIPEYYEIEVISRGSDLESRNVRLKPENWTEIYAFKGGKYELVRHRNFVEVSKPRKKAPK